MTGIIGKIIHFKRKNNICKDKMYLFINFFNKMYIKRRINVYLFLHAIVI